MRHLVVVWRGCPNGPAPLAALLPRASVARDDGTLEPVTFDIVDDAGNPVHLGALQKWREVVRHLWLRAMNVVLAALVFLAARRRSPAPGPTTPGTGPVVLVLPVLPDLSHTFVYREVLALLRHRPDWRIVVLQRNERAPRHAEAEALLARATFLPREGITRRALRLLGWLATRRGRALFAQYRAEPGSRLGDLLGKQPLRDPRHPGNAFALADQLRALAPRHLHVYASTWPANVALGAASLLGVPCSISSYVDFEFPYSHKMLAAKLRQATFCRVVTASCAQRLRDLPEAEASQTTRIPVVLLGLDLANWRQRATPRGDGTLFSAARFVPKKGLRHVPEALARLREQGVPVRWRVAGSGPEESLLRAECTRHRVDDLVTFLGPLDSEAVRRELLTADLAVLPCVVAEDGERDGIPIFLCEAMALGVPVVTTNISGIPELIRDGDTGFLVAPGDTMALAATLERALGDRAATAAIAERGRAAVHRELEVDRLAALLVAEIER